MPRGNYGEMTMKMAKASQSDMDMALKLCSALEAIDRRFFPEGSEGDNDPEDFGLECDEHCGMVLRHLYEILQGGSIGRVIWGMYVLMDPENEVVDPDASTLEPHPKTLQMEEQRDELLEALKAVRLQWLQRGVVTDPEHPDRVAMDRADAIIAQVEGHNTEVKGD